MPAESFRSVQSPDDDAAGDWLGYAWGISNFQVSEENMRCDSLPRLLSKIRLEGMNIPMNIQFSVVINKWQ